MSTIINKKVKEQIESQGNEPLHYQRIQKPQQSERIASLFDYVTHAPAGICHERAKYVTEVYSKNSAQPPIVVRALALKATLDQMTIFVLPNSLLVGNLAAKPNYAPLFPEFAVDFLKREIFQQDPMSPTKRPADRFIVDARILPDLEEIFEWWDGKTHKDRVYANLPNEAILAQDEIDVINIVNFMHGGDGHFSPPYKWLCKHGLRYIIDVCKIKMNDLDLSTDSNIDRYRFYKAASISCEAVIEWANRYSELLIKEAEVVDNSDRKLELLEMARICKKVPEHPADTFHEAMQFLLFIQFAIQIEDNAQGISPGRFDQEFIEFYLNDIELGKMNANRGLELVQNVFILLSMIERIRSWEDTAYFRGKPIFQNLTIGGIDPSTGKDAVNALTYVVLDAIANTRTLQPSHYARWHKNAPEQYKLRIAEVIRLGTGFPALANDDLYIKAMMGRGYSWEDAANYCIVGCAEPGVAGLRGGRTGAAWFCYAKVMELSLYNGRDPRTGVQLYQNSNGKELSECTSFDEVWASFEDQTRYYARLSVIMDNITDRLWEEYIEEPLSSILACPETVIDRGKSLKRGGAKYDFSGNETIGTAVVANSLYAIKYLVFEKRIITSLELQHALETNFEDRTTKPTGLEIEQMCLNAPKFGNDIDDVDFLAKKVLELICIELPKYKNTRSGKGPIGCVFQASTTTVSSNTPFGLITGATPDGRKKGVALSDGQSPMRGTDVQGPTAAVCSVAKLNNELLSEGSLYNLKLLPQDLQY